MSINVGGVNLVDLALTSEYKIMVLEKIVEKLLAGSPAAAGIDVKAIQKAAVADLQRKYPDAGIEFKAG